MSTLNKERELLRELVSSRKYLFTMLADEAKERGEEYKGKAWEWLRDHNKWPSPANRIVGGRYGYRKKGFAWCINDKARFLDEAERKGPSVLPYRLYSYFSRWKRIDTNKVYTTEEDAFREVISNLADLIKYREDELKRKQQEEAAKNNSETA